MALRTYRHSTPQTEPLNSRQSKNHAGGYAYKIDDWKRLERFLILGSDGGTYYVKEQKLTRENALCVERCIKADGIRTVDIIVNVSDRGRAPKNDPALFALAMCAKLGDLGTRRYANQMLPKVARIGTHLLHFAEYVKIFGGFGPSVHKSLGRWFTSKSADDLAFQAVKYPQRDGWSLADVLRKSRPYPTGTDTDRVIDWIVDGLDGNDVSVYPRIIQGTEEIRGVKDAAVAAKIITDYRLPFEVVPSDLLNDVQVWSALLPNLGMTALIRNLPKMTKIDLLTHGSQETVDVIDRLTNRDQLRRARIHPIQLLVALTMYNSGKTKNLEFTAVQKIVDALDAAFYMSFENVEPTNKNIMIGLDVSGSMGWESISPTMPLTARDASAALCLIMARTEKNCEIMAFSDHLVEVKINPTWRLDQVVKKVSKIPYGGTDCSLPVKYAFDSQKNIDAFITYTDNETWAGKRHTDDRLAEYRKKINPSAKMIVNGMTATDISIADPEDPGMLDVVGFDTAAPAVMADFIRN